MSRDDRAIAFVQQRPFRKYCTRTRSLVTAVTTPSTHLPRLELRTATVLPMASSLVACRPRGRSSSGITWMSPSKVMLAVSPTSGSAWGSLFASGVTVSASAAGASRAFSPEAPCMSGGRSMISPNSACMSRYSAFFTVLTQKRPPTVYMTRTLSPSVSVTTAWTLLPALRLLTRISAPTPGRRAASASAGMLSWRPRVSDLSSAQGGEDALRLREASRPCDPPAL
mmetsp:Transcript_123871/g.361726  ORF Transcript_123871/g.361726 Transcript_123871/m.361726 type:complete len:226 (-) Transcript_123871:575-1252(-)